jgi:mRNA interferase MazF
VKRGDIVTVAAKGAYSGKPRPALIVQSDFFIETGSVTVCLFSTTAVDAPLLRIAVDPTPETGLQKPSQIMIDKMVTVPREAVGTRIGMLDDAQMIAVDRSLALFLGIVKATEKRKRKRKPRT